VSFPLDELLESWVDWKSELDEGDNKDDKEDEAEEEEGFEDERLVVSAVVDTDFNR